MNKLLYSSREAAEMLSLSRTTIFELLRRGELRSIKIGRSRRIPASALEEFVAGIKDSRP